MHFPKLLHPALLSATLALVGFSGPCRAQDLAAGYRVADLKCEYARDPLGMDLPQPRLQWRVESATRGQRQTAWRVLVASSLEKLNADTGDLWDSGRVDTDQSTFVSYAGKPLLSLQQVYWKLRSWDMDGKPSPWSEPATWTMSLLKSAEWKGHWIAAPWTTEALLLRREFNVRPGLKRALLNVSGMGQYEAFLNGRKAGNDILSPGWTNYDKTTLVDQLDVSALLKTGPNAIGLELGNGMYNVVRRHRFSKFTRSFGPLRAIAHLDLEYSDGSHESVGTDESWQVHPGPVVFNSIYGGEDHDARLRQSGWDMPGFPAVGWSSAVPVNRPPDTLKGFSRAAEPLREIESRKPVSIRVLRPGTVLYDFGQNASFMPRLRVSGPAGSTVRMTPGEVVNEDGSIDRGTMGGAHRGSAWWQYTKAGDDEESWFPQFYYVGSRYLSVELLPSQPGAALPKVESLESVIVHSIASPIGDFSCSNPLLNRIRDLVRWAQRSNMVSTLTDCPHREKLGWIEQYHLNGPAIRYEFDVARIYNKGMWDMAEAQTAEGMIVTTVPDYTDFKGGFRGAAEWGVAFLLVPWQHYEFTGDIEPLRAHYNEMKRYFAFLESIAKDDILSLGLGDWYDYLPGTGKRADLTPPPITATAFFFEDAKLLARTAALLGHKEEAQKYAARAEQIKKSYIAKFRRAEDGLYGTASQASLAIPLVMDLADSKDRALLLKSLVSDVETRGYATAGDIAYRYLLTALSNAGRSDVIYKLINQDEKPGYGYQLKQGATALAESWHASREASHNHFMLGQITEWFYKELVGIASDPEGPGFKKILIRPHPVGDLTWAQASYDSIHGAIRVRWEREAGNLKLKIHIPANTTATVYVPCNDSSSVREGGTLVDGKSQVRLLRVEGDRAVYAVGSGSYDFTSQWQ